MDSLLSPIVADIVLQDFEEKTLNMLNVNLSFYYLFYVDDKIMAYGIIDILPLPISSIRKIFKSIAQSVTIYY